MYLVGFSVFRRSYLIWSPVIVCFLNDIAPQLQVVAVNVSLQKVTQNVYLGHGVMNRDAI